MSLESQRSRIEKQISPPGHRVHRKVLNSLVIFGLNEGSVEVCVGAAISQFGQRVEHNKIASTILLTPGIFGS